MPYIFNGTKRAKTFTVTKYVNNVAESPVTYVITNVIPNTSYGAITNDTYQKLTEQNFILRRDAFINYIYSLNLGITINPALFEIAGSECVN